MIKNFNDFINENQTNESFNFLAFADEKNDKKALKMLKQFYDDAVAGEDFYPGLDDMNAEYSGSDTYQRANDRLDDLIKKGYLSMPDEDGFLDYK